MVFDYLCDVLVNLNVQFIFPLALFLIHKQMESNVIERKNRLMADSYVANL